MMKVSVDCRKIQRKLKTGDDVLTIATRPTSRRHRESRRAGRAAITDVSTLAAYDLVMLDPAFQGSTVRICFSVSHAGLTFSQIDIQCSLIIRGIDDTHGIVYRLRRFGRSRARSTCIEARRLPVTAS